MEIFFHVKVEMKRKSEYLNPKSGIFQFDAEIFFYRGAFSNFEFLS